MERDQRPAPCTSNNAWFAAVESLRQLKLLTSSQELLGQDPALMQNEIQRRMQEAKKADPLRQREQYLHRQQARSQNKIDRLLTADQRALTADDIVRLLREGTVEFVVADVGQKPRWIAPTEVLRLRRF
jgi:hypothetical protein